MNGGEAGKEALAREQYFFFKDIVNQSLVGDLNGSVGVYGGERRLRRLMGLAANDGRLIRPVDEPLTTKIVYQWDEIQGQAVSRRAEVRRQQWELKRTELELIAARNLAKPQLDLIALYRPRGLGDVYGTGTNGALNDLFSGDHQEYQLGIEYTNPVGNRQALAGVRHAAIKRQRAAAVLAEQQLNISHDLSDALSEADRAFESINNSRDRLIAARDSLNAQRVSYDAGRVVLDLLLRSQTTASEAEVYHARALRDYMVALKNVELQRGNLLQANQIDLTEGSWCPSAYDDAARVAKVWKPRRVLPLDKPQQTLSCPNP